MNKCHIFAANHQKGNQSMKKTVFVTMIMLGSALPGLAQSNAGYRPMFVEGRSWKTAILHYSGEEMEKVDTVSVHTYKYEDLKWSFTEADRKVYRNSEHGRNVEFDFNLQAGDTFVWTDGNGTMSFPPVVSVDTIRVRGRDYRRIVFDAMDFWGDPYCWVEGIGSSMYGPYSFTDGVMAISNRQVLAAVYDGDECIFTFDDFKSPAIHPQKDSYRPLLVEGRTWNLFTFTAEPSADGTGYVRSDSIFYSVTVEGMDEKGGKACYRVHSTDPFNSGFRYFYEQDGLVFSWADDRWRLEFCFDADAGEQVGYGDLRVSAVDNLIILGNAYRRYQFAATDYCRIEGIGDLVCGPFCLYNFPIITQESDDAFEKVEPQLLSVYDGDKCIFTLDAYKAIQPSSIGTVSAASNAGAAPLFDLQGRRLSAKPVKGMYIQGGRKYVVK